MKTTTIFTSGIMILVCAASFFGGMCYQHMKQADINNFYEDTVLNVDYVRKTAQKHYLEHGEFPELVESSLGGGAPVYYIASNDKQSFKIEIDYPKQTLLSKSFGFDDYYTKTFKLPYKQYGGE